MDSYEINDLRKLKGFNIVHINIRSIFNKLDEFFLTFGELDVIVVSETWLNSSISDAAIALPGFNLVRQDRTGLSNKRGEGLFMYIKSTLKYSSLGTELNN